MRAPLCYGTRKWSWANGDVKVLKSLGGGRPGGKKRVVQGRRRESNNNVWLSPHKCQKQEGTDAVVIRLDACIRSHNKPKSVKKNRRRGKTRCRNRSIGAMLLFPILFFVLLCGISIFAPIPPSFFFSLVTESRLLLQVLPQLSPCLSIICFRIRPPWRLTYKITPIHLPNLLVRR